MRAPVVKFAADDLEGARRAAYWLGREAAVEIYGEAVVVAAENTVSGGQRGKRKASEPR